MFEVECVLCWLPLQLVSSGLAGKLVVWVNRLVDYVIMAGASVFLSMGRERVGMCTSVGACSLSGGLLECVYPFAGVCSIEYVLCVHWDMYVSWYFTNCLTVVFLDAAQWMLTQLGRLVVLVDRLGVGILPIVFLEMLYSGC